MQFFAFIATFLAVGSAFANPSQNVKRQSKIQVELYNGDSGTGNFLILDLTPGICTTLPDTAKNIVNSVLKPRGVECRIYDGDNCLSHQQILSRDQRFYCQVDKEQKNDVNSIECQ